jgi:N-hydroxyarylamine O-acetyltransferase
MAVEQFDIDAWFSRIGYDASRDPTLGNLKRLVTAHATAIAYESIDVLLNKPPSLDPKLLQSKMILVDEAVTALNRTCCFAPVCFRLDKR